MHNQAKIRQPMKMAQLILTQPLDGIKEINFNLVRGIWEKRNGKSDI